MRMWEVINSGRLFKSYNCSFFIWTKLHSLSNGFYNSIGHIKFSLWWEYEVQLIIIIIIYLNKFFLWFTYQVTYKISYSLWHLAALPSCELKSHLGLPTGQGKPSTTWRKNIGLGHLSIESWGFISSQLDIRSGFRS